VGNEKLQCQLAAAAAVAAVAAVVALTCWEASTQRTGDQICQSTRSDVRGPTALPKPRHYRSGGQCNYWHGCAGLSSYCCGSQSAESLKKVVVVLHACIGQCKSFVTVLHVAWTEIAGAAQS